MFKKQVLSMFWFVLILICLAGCGGGDGTPGGSHALKKVSWYLLDAAPDYANTGATCFLVTHLYYQGTLAQNDIASYQVISPNGWHWTINAPNLNFGSNSDGEPYISGMLYYGDNPYVFPLSGTWTFKLVLASGETASFTRVFHEPGSAANATHAFTYAVEDWAPALNSSQYVSLLTRFPAQGYTVQYSAANGGSLKTTGLPAIMAAFLASEQRAYNFRCWLYDAGKNYIGSTIPEYSSTDHSNTDLLSLNGELSIVPISTYSPSGAAGGVNLADVKYLRIVYCDGSQYAPNSYTTFDYRSVSQLVPVQ